MANQLGPLEVSCDAPPYPIVQACWQIGFESPEDVRWSRLSHHRSRLAAWRQLAKFTPFHVFLVNRDLGNGVCTCGKALPALQNYVFTLATGEEYSCFLAQCSRCRSVYWEEA